MTPSGAVQAQNTALSNHRGLLVVNTAATNNTAITFTNIDGTTCAMVFAPGTTLLPLQIWKYSFTVATNMYIYGLV
jgi:hypothetical protein